METIIAKWVKEHCPNWRTPIHAPGEFENYSQSKASCCWGQPVGGMRIGAGKVFIAVCQPSPERGRKITPFFYDYVTKS